ncbi:daptide biosynthesis RiPP recognition protein [Streptomyces sp. NPDC058655]|uniref:daptide biosynthesis RiPP recognition protein n=1 Tax=Streptomyces sp. NPDC058655 TaxID=3346577 RepID=UPI00365F6CCE
MSGIKGRLTVWAAGTDSAACPVGSGSGTGVLVLENADHLAQVLRSDLVDLHTTVFAPGHTGSSEGPAVVGYEGSPSESGAEFSIPSDSGDFFLQLQSYGISEYMSVVGPTLVRVADPADFDAYLSDADRARQDGVFADFLTHPVIQLGDLCALGADATADGPRLRLYVNRAGELSTSPGGSRLGTLGDGLAALQAEWARINGASAHPCAVSLGTVVPEAERAAALAERPWLSRYLAAVEAARRLRFDGSAVPRVSGFGHRLTAGLPDGDAAADAVGTGLPLVLWTDEASYVHTATGGRTFQVDHLTARVVEALLACGSVAAAAAFADREVLEGTAARFAAAGVRLTSPALVALGS